MTARPRGVERYESGLEAARSALQPEGFEKAWQNGLAMSMDQAIEFALDDQ